MADGHLVLDGSKGVVCGLLDHAITEPGEVLFDGLSFFIGFLEQLRVAWYASSGIIGDVDISRAAVNIKVRIVDRTFVVKVFSDFSIDLNWASVFDPLAMFFGAQAAGFHGQAPRTNGNAVPVEILIGPFLLISRIDGNKGLGLHRRNDQFVELFDIVGLVADEDFVPQGAVDAFEFLDQLPGYLSVGSVVR